MDNLKDIGIDPIKGGGVVVVCGVVAKNSPWSMVDKETKKPISGHSFQVAFFGGVLKVDTQDGDPLREIGVGEQVILRYAYTAPSGKPMQLGRALALDPKTLKPLTPTS